MRLKFLHVSIENFLSLGHVELDLNDMGYTLIKGVNSNPVDGAVSNGSGKSAIFDAIVWALTGETIRGITKNIGNIHTEGGTGVSLLFTVDSTEYKICRYKDHKKQGTSLQIFINGEDKSGKGIRDSEKLLAEYLPDLTLQFIGSVIIFGQGLPQRFTNNTPSGRKEVLEKLSKSDFMIEDIKNRLSNRKAALSTELRGVEDRLIELTSGANVLKSQLQERQKEWDGLESADSLLAEMEQAKSHLETLKQDLTSAMEADRALEQSFNEVSLTKSNEYSKQASKRAEIADKYSTLLFEKQGAEAALGGQIRSLEAEIHKLKNIVDVCPTCGQKLPNVHKVDTSEKEAELAGLKNSLIKVRQELSSITAEKQAEEVAAKKEGEAVLLQLDNTLMQLKQQVQSSKSSISSKTQECRHWEGVYNSSSTKYETLEQHRSVLKSTIDSLTQEIEKTEQESLYINKSKEELKSRLDIVSKMITIATRDFRGFLLSNVIEYINSRAKLYSKDIFGTDRIEFSLSGNNIDIAYDDKVYENLSGGEAQKVNIIINLALRDMLCHFSNFSSNILVLDEITDALDAAGCAKVIDVITKRLVDIESVFIITHRAELMIPADTTITICKDASGVSSIVQ